MSLIDAGGIKSAFTALGGSYEVTTGIEFLATGDLKRELGITLEDQQYQARLEALTKPKDYYNRRKLLTDQMTTEVQLAFQKSFAEYANSGLPNDVSRQYAMQAARTAMAAKMQLIELRFPSGANAIGSAASNREYALPGSLPTRRAPANKRRTRRR
jgi:hypothetical protein